eukprot:1443802-Amphidinium_carterae.1
MLQLLRATDSAEADSKSQHCHGYNKKKDRKNQNGPLCYPYSLECNSVRFLFHIDAGKPLALPKNLHGAAGREEVLPPASIHTTRNGRVPTERV